MIEIGCYGFPVSRKKRYFEHFPVVAIRQPF